jgi:hypothetical protein
VHGTKVYFVGVGSKGLASERFPDIKKKKKSCLASCFILNFSCVGNGDIA